MPFLTYSAATLGWMSLAVSPSRLYQMYRQRQLRFSYLEELFDSDDQRLDLADDLAFEDDEFTEEAEEEVVPERRLAQVRGRRKGCP